MTAAITTPVGHALPPFARHAVTFSLPTMADAERMIQGDMGFLMSLKSFYPRIIPDQDVRKLAGIISQRFGIDGKGCAIFSSPEAAAGCLAFVTSPLRREKMVAAEIVELRVFEVGLTRLYTVFLPMEKFAAVAGYARSSGFGISGRFAEQILSEVDSLVEVKDFDLKMPNPSRVPEGPAHAVLRQRLAGLYERAPAVPHPVAVNPDTDIFLFQTGMTTIWQTHQYIISRFEGSAVLFGFAFSSTIDIMNEVENGTPNKFLGLGNADDLDDLEQHLKNETAAGRRVAVVYAEYYTNPLAVTPDLPRLRALADTWGFVLVLDDTLGCVANIDVMGARGADIVLTSLTKSFSGYADVMGGSVVLNPCTPAYKQLQPLFRDKFFNDYHADDAAALEHNSRDYLARSAKHNANTAALIEAFERAARNPHSAVTKVYSVMSDAASKALFDATMRATTTGGAIPDTTGGDADRAFTPGYGLLFTVDFADDAALRAFYDAMNVHKGPHLGAHRTLMIPYTRIIYSAQLRHDAYDYAWAAQYGNTPTQMRVAPGLEEPALLVSDVEKALGVVDAAWRERSNE